MENADSSDYELDDRNIFDLIWNLFMQNDWYQILEIIIYKSLLVKYYRFQIWGR
mgnify:CR=1 FL=1